MLPRLHTHPHLTNAPQKRLQCHPDFRAGFPVEEFHAQGVKSLDVSFKVVAGEVGVAFHDVDDDGPPGFDVAGLGFV